MSVANDKFRTVLQRLQENPGTVCVDVETSGLDWRKNHIVGYVVTFGPDPADSYYIPVRHAGGGNLGDRPGPQEAESFSDAWITTAEHALIKALSTQKLIFGHNIAFDLKFLSRVGLALAPRFEDTMINAALIDEWQGKFSLEFCAEQAGVFRKQGAEMAEHLCTLFPEVKPRGAMGHFWRTAGCDPNAVSYAEGDGTSTWQLREVQMKNLADQDLGLVHDIESRLIPVLARMTVKGIRIDEERLGELKMQVEGQIGELMEEFPHDFNPRSPQDVENWCRDAGQTDWPLTPKTGKPAFPEGWLSTHEAGRMVVQVRKLSTLLSTFITPMIETHLFNGRVHADYNQLRGDEFGTVTGRLSCSNPNLQQVPKRDKKLGRLFRSIFIPDVGNVWASVDYSQCEPRLLAFYSRCKVLLDDYRNNPDADSHQAVATAAGIGRFEGKQVNQTLIAGGGKGILTKRYGIPAERVEELWDAYFGAMPEIRDLQRKAGHRMQQRGYVLSLLGRRARLKDYNKSYTAINRLLQCGNADIIKLKMVEIDEYLESVGRPMDMLINIHDDISYQFPEEARPHYERCLKIMTSFTEEDLITLDVPMKVDPGEGPNWAIATYGEEIGE